MTGIWIFLLSLAVLLGALFMFRDAGNTANKNEHKAPEQNPENDKTQTPSDPD